jgi:nucleoside-diphosphate-sugar epimerase
VTGAGGFIGRALCRKLRIQGFELSALVAPPGVELEDPPELTLGLRATLDDAEALDRVCAGACAVVHLAGPPSVRASFQDPAAYANAHLGGTAAVLEAARRAEIQRFVYVSSAEVYGRTGEAPVGETQPPSARSPYAAAKVGAEQLIRAYGHAYGTMGAILRPFSVYGPGMNDYALVSTIVRQLEGEGALELADLSPVRDYVFVDDCAEALALAVTAPLREPSTFNVGTGVGTSVAALVRCALAVAGSRRTLEQRRGLPQRPGAADILYLVADPARAREGLGWTARTPLADGLQRMIERQRLG